MPRSRTVIGVIVLGMLLSAAPVTAAAARTARGSLSWKRCGGGFQCSTLRVPVDYSKPKGDRVGLALIRMPAGDPSRRIGSLVINFGGPGDPGTETLRNGGLTTLPREIRDRFDIVSFDPRGTGSSRPIDCVDDTTFDKLWAEDPTPDSPADLRGFYDGSAFSVDLVRQCVKRQGGWLADVGTRNVARDLDRIRAALGEAKLNYLGYSYGTVLGAVYAQAFPKRIRAFVLDSAVDLSSSFSEQQQRNAAGFEHALDEFLADCAARPGCSFHSDGDPRRALDDLRNQFENGLVLPTRDGRRVGVSEFYVAILATLYSEDYWSILADALSEATTLHEGTEIRLINDVYAGRRDDGTYNNFQEAIGIINCDDRPSPRVSFDQYRQTFDQFSKDYPFFGRAFAGTPVGCDPRLPHPKAGDSLGDVRSQSAPPILIVGVTSDPATPYEGALDLQRRLRGSRVLTLESTRHGGYAQGISCIDQNVDRYLLTRKLPAAGVRCKP